MNLFLPDKYDERCPKFINVAASALMSTIRDLLTDYYGFPSANDIDVKASGAAEANSSNYHVVAKDQDLLVKRFDRSVCTSRLLHKLRLYKWLSERDTPVAKVREGSSQQLITDHADYNWCVLQFIKGMYFSGTDEEIIDAAKTTETLIHTLKEAKKLLPPVCHRTEFPEPNDCLQLMALLKKRRNEWRCLLGSESASVVSDEWSTIESSFSEYSRSFPSAFEDTLLSHIDLHPHNLLFNDGRVIAVLDFESLQIAPPAIMVSFSALKLLRHAAACRNSSTGGVRPRDLVETYRSGLSDKGFLPDRARSLAKREIIRRLYNLLRNALRGGHELWKWPNDIKMHVLGLVEAEELFPESFHHASS